MPGPRFPKDGINDHVLAGAATVNPAARGSKCAAWYRLTVGGGETVELRLRLSPAAGRTSTTWSPPAAPKPTSSTPT